MHIQATGTGWILEVEQVFPVARDELFKYFSDAGNLQEITPPWLSFEIVTPLPIDMHAGTLIDYRLRLHHVPINWRTEISIWEPPVRFVDRQLRGPYRRWIHEHTFHEHPAGTLMTDRVNYSVPGGKLIHAAVVRRSLKRIFQYRQEILAERFSTHHKVSG